MEVKTHHGDKTKIAEIVSDTVCIKTVEDGLNLLGNLYYQGFDKIIIRTKNLTPDFFDLKTGIAGEILQKFSTYNIPLAVVGDFSGYASKSVKCFMIESNKNRHINFVESVEKALEIFSADKNINSDRT
ncbi:MAG: DUF4180 domain-containing protein [Bacteroidales bacterium]|nr:DUF4180 domain-containing protein [Bacteroidales bacterium]